MLGPRRSESPDRREKGRQLQRLPSWHIGISLWGEGSAAPRPSGPTAAPPSRGGGLGGGPAPSGTCLPGALPRGPAPTPPGRQLSSRRPGNRRRLLSVTWGRCSQSRARWARSTLGGKAGALGILEANFPGAEVKRSCPRGVARCGSVSRVLPSANAVRSFLSTSGALALFPALGMSPHRLKLQPQELVASPEKRNPQEKIHCTVFAGKDGIRYFNFTGVIQDHLRTCLPRSA